MKRKKTALSCSAGKKAALTALNWKNSGVNGVEKKKTALKLFNWKNSSVNGIELRK